jgi:hypothetical protein
MDGDARVNDMLEALRELHGLQERIAKLSAPRVEEAVRAQAAAGLDPEGRPWTPTKDGRRPLVHAANAIHVDALGDIVVIVLTGKEVFHHFGTGRVAARRIIPDGEVPERIRRIIADVAGEVFEGKR